MFGRTGKHRLSVVFFTALLTIAAASRPAGWLGIGFSYETSSGPDGKVRHWLLVRRIAPGSPAEKAGLRAQDVITQMDGKAFSFRSVAEALDAFESIRAGDRIVFTVFHERTTRRVRMTAVELPAALRGIRDANRRLARQ